ncbi:MAG: BatA domain-containing protein [bacterium]
MSFLTPGLLWTLPLAGLPLLFYWLEQQSRNQIEYPSLQWLDDSFREQLQSRRRRRWLQVLWRMLLIALFILMMSQPIIGKKNTDSNLLVVVIDNSLSMEQSSLGKSALERSKQWIKSRMDKFNVRRIKVARGLPNPEWIGTYRPGEQPDLGPVKTFPGKLTLKSIQTWISNQNLPVNSRILFLTDVQRPLFDELYSSTHMNSIEIVDTTKPVKNRTLLSGKVRPSTLYQNQSAVINWNTRSGKATPQRIGFRDGIVLSPDPGDQYVTWAPPKPTTYAGTIALAPDGLEWDNHWYFTVDVRKKLPVYTIGKSPVLRALEYTLDDRIRTVNKISNAKLVIMGDTGLSGRDGKALKTAVQNEIPRLVMLSPQFNRTQFEETLSGQGFPWRIKGAYQYESVRSMNILEDEWFPGLQRIPEDVIRRLTLQSVIKISNRDRGQELIRAGNDPVFIRKGNWHLLTAPATQFLSPETASAGWPALLQQITQGALQRRTSVTWEAGRPAKWPETLTFPITVRTPSGVNETVERKRNVYQPANVGIYTVNGSKGRRFTVACNFSRREADLDKLPNSEWPESVISYRGSGKKHWNLSFVPYLWFLLAGGIALDSWLG